MANARGANDDRKRPREGGARDDERDRKVVRKEVDVVEDKDIARLYEGLATGLVRILVKSKFLSKPECEVPSIVAKPPAPEENAEGPTDHLIPEAEIAEVSWNASNYSACEWKAYLTVNDKRVAHITGSFHEAPNAGTMQLPSTVQVTTAIPAAWLKVVEKVCGNTPQIDLAMDEESRKHIKETVFEPSLKRKEVPVIEVGDAMLCLVDGKEKVSAYALTKDAYNEALKAEGSEKPALVICMEMAMLTLLCDGNISASYTPVVEDWAKKVGDVAAEVMEKSKPLPAEYAGISALAAEGLSELMSAASEKFNMTVVTTTPLDFAKAALGALGLGSMNVVSWTTKDLAQLYPFSPQKPPIVIDSLQDTWPAQQQEFLLPGTSIAKWTEMLTQLSGADSVATMLKDLRSNA